MQMVEKRVKGEDGKETVSLISLEQLQTELSQIGAPSGKPVVMMDGDCPGCGAHWSYPAPAQDQGMVVGCGVCGKEFVAKECSKECSPKK